MPSAIFDPRRSLLCGRANAERIALRLSEETGENHAVFRTENQLQPLKVMRSDWGREEAMELQVVVL